MRPGMEILPRPSDEGDCILSSRSAEPNVYQRPHTLAEVVRRAETGMDWDMALAEFLDTFYFALRGYPGPDPQSCLDAEPAVVGDPVWQAQLGAIGEHLAARWYLVGPRWTHAPSRFLNVPHYPSGTERYKGWYFVQSPTAFRRRMIFTEAEPLRRARFPCAAFFERDRRRGYQWTDGTVKSVFAGADPGAGVLDDTDSRPRALNPAAPHCA